jgi:hypothetical protein
MTSDLTGGGAAAVFATNCDRATMNRIESTLQRLWLDTTDTNYVVPGKFSQPPVSSAVTIASGSNQKYSTEQSYFIVNVIPVTKMECALAAEVETREAEFLEQHTSAINALNMSDIVKYCITITVVLERPTTHAKPQGVLLPIKHFVDLEKQEPTIRNLRIQLCKAHHRFKICFEMISSKTLENTTPTPGVIAAAAAAAAAAEQQPPRSTTESRALSSEPAPSWTSYIMKRLKIAARRFAAQDEYEDYVAKFFQSHDMQSALNEDQDFKPRNASISRKRSRHGRRLHDDEMSASSSSSSDEGDGVALSRGTVFPSSKRVKVEGSQSPMKGLLESGASEDISAATPGVARF